MTPQRTCFLATPTYNGLISSSTSTSIINASRELHVSICDFGGSLLPDVFNRAYLYAVLNGYDLFAMIHADIEAPPFWLDELVHILDERNADIVSSVVTIKDTTNDTSTGYTFQGGSARLSHEDIRRLPPVFGDDEIQALYPHSTGILINTGLWVARLRRDNFALGGPGEMVELPWCRKWPGFTLQSSIDWTSDPPKIRTASEDYLMSAALRRIDPPPRVLATSVLGVRHYGPHWWETPKSGRVVEVGDGAATHDPTRTRDE